MSKTIVVFGANNDIGGAVLKLLNERGDKVIKVGKNGKNIPSQNCFFADVGDYIKVKHVANRLRHDSIMIDSIIYAVGSYEKDGYWNHTEYSLSTIPYTVVQNEIDTQLFGLFAVFQNMRPYITSGGSIIFAVPFHEELSHGVISYEGQECLIRWMRDDPLAQRRDIKIHHLGVPGVCAERGDTEAVKDVVSCLYPLEMTAKYITDALSWSSHDSVKNIYLRG